MRSLRWVRSASLVAVAALIVATGAEAVAAPVPGVPPAPAGVPQEVDPDPIPPVEDELIDPVEALPPGPVPPAEPVEDLVEAPPLEEPVLPAPEVAELPVDEPAPPPEDPVDPPGEEQRVAGVEFPLAVYLPDEIPDERIAALHPGAQAGNGLDPVVNEVDPRSAGREAGETSVEVPTSVSAQVLDPEVVGDLGGVGLGFTLTRSDDVSVAGYVTGDAVYNGFRDAFGADFALRLQLTSLPACALTTPEVEGCLARTPIDSQNLWSQGILRSVLEVAADPGAGDRVTDGGGVVYVVDSTAEGPTGSFKATPVDAAGRWDVGVGSGAFTWSEPLPTVPVPSGATGEGPVLSYSSQSVDGRTSSSNNQASWVGLGWELNSGSIDRQFEPCQKAGHPSSWGDLCWESARASVTLNGVTSELVPLSSSPSHPEEGAPTTWRLRDDPGWKVTEEVDPAGGTYWRVVTPDGTEYLFGYKDPYDGGHPGREDTDSKFGARVYGAPIWAGAGCSVTSLCPTPWRWNVSHVKETVGTTAVYRYKKESNFYRSVAALGANVEYDRAGHLLDIDFGRQWNETSAQAWSRLSYSSAWRCTDLDDSCAAHSPFFEGNETKYPDVPLDLVCNGSGRCPKAYPSFFSVERLTKVQAAIKKASGAWAVTDTANLTANFPVNPDGTNSHLWLDNLDVLGNDGGSMALPTIKFDGIPRPNRVDPAQGKPAMDMHRISGVHTSLGGHITVLYGQPDLCGPLTLPAHEYDNVQDCFAVPLRDEEADPDGIGWYHKYLVSQVSSSGLAIDAPVTTVYNYSGDPAWHYDDNVTADGEDRHWSEWRGYGEVTVTTGLSKDLYLVHRGMHLDKTDAPGSFGRRNIVLEDSQGLQRADHNWLRGRIYEHRRYSGGTQIERSNYGYSFVRQTTDDMTDIGAARMIVQPWEEQRLLPGAPDEKVYRTESTFSVVHGQPVTIFERGDMSLPGGGGPSDDRCTQTTYVLLEELPYQWIVRPSEVARYQGSCASGTAVAKSELRYDGHADVEAAPVDGLLTKTSNATGAGTWLSTQTTYDDYGRVTSVTDPSGETTSTVYLADGAPDDQLPADGLPDTIKTTNPLLHVTTTKLSDVRRLPQEVIDANGHRTAAAFDPLGRTVSVWLPGQATTDDPSLKYGYNLSLDKTQPARVTTQTHLRDSGTGTAVYIHNHAYFDGLGRPTETQSVAPHDGNKRLVADTRYDNRGLVAAKTEPTLVAGVAGTSMAAPAPADVSAETRNTYDALGRVSSVAKWSHNAPMAGHTTTYSYGATSITTTPPLGMETTSHNDAFGQLARVVEHYPTGMPGYPIDNWTTDYTYNARGDLLGIEDAEGNVTNYTYDWLSRRTSSNDPNAGTWTTTYTKSGQPETVTDAEGDATFAVYDQLGRQTKLHETDAQGPLLAEWKYDQGVNRHGLLTESTSWDGAVAYRTTNLAYNDRDQLTGKTYEIPVAAPGDTAGNYSYTYAYDQAGHRTSTTYPAAGGLEAETVTTGYSVRGYETNLVGTRASGSNTYIASTTYTDFGAISERAYGGTGDVVRDYTYQAGTRWLGRVNTLLDGVNLQNTNYNYDVAGNLKGIDTAGSSTLNECFSHDPANRLSDAVTRTGAGCTGPVAATGTAGAYNTSYSYTASGNLAVTTNKYGPAGQHNRYIYGQIGAGGPHAVTEITEFKDAEPGGPGGPTTQPPPDGRGVGTDRGTPAATATPEPAQPAVGPSAPTPTAASRPTSAPTVLDTTPSGRLAIEEPPEWELTTAELTYDDNGQMISHDSDPLGSGPSISTTYTWTSRHKLESVTVGSFLAAKTTTFAYDADNNRLVRNEAGTVTVYLEGMELTDTPAAAPVATRYYSTGSGLAVGLRGATGPWVRVLLNHQGSTQYLIKNGDNATSLLEYDPYGATRMPADTDALATDRRYLNAPHDDTASLVHLAARSYDPSLAAFLSPDPLLNLANPQSLNPYRYALNNPSTYTDPSGLIADEGCGCSGGGGGPADPYEPPSGDDWGGWWNPPSGGGYHSPRHPSSGSGWSVGRTINHPWEEAGAAGSLAAAYAEHNKKIQEYVKWKISTRTDGNRVRVLRARNETDLMNLGRLKVLGKFLGGVGSVGEGVLAWNEQYSYDIDVNHLTAGEARERATQRSILVTTGAATLGAAGLAAGATLCVASVACGLVLGTAAGIVGVFGGNVVADSLLGRTSLVPTELPYNPGFGAPPPSYTYYYPTV